MSDSDETAPTPGQNGLFVLDEDTGQVTLDPLDNPSSWAVAVDSITHTAYVSNNYTGSVEVINELTGSVTAVIPNVTYAAREIAVDPTAHRVYVTSGETDNRIAVIDEETNTTISYIDLDIVTNCIAVDPSTHHVIVDDPYSNKVVIVDEATGAVTKTIRAYISPASCRLGVDPTTDTVYVPGTHGTMFEINDLTGVARRPVVGFQPLAIAVDPTRHTVYIAHDANYVTGQSSFITAFDPRTSDTTATLPSQPYGAHDLAVDPATHSVYVADGLAMISFKQVPNTVRPSVSAVSPGTVSTVSGQTVTISGTGFTGAAAVWFGNRRAIHYSVHSDTLITALTPAHARGTVAVRVQTYRISPRTSTDTIRFVTP